MSAQAASLLENETFVGTVDRMMEAAAVIHPMTALPQVIHIYATHNVSGVSIVTWLGFMGIGTIFLTYALCHKLRPLIITQALWFAIDFLVVAGVILYR